MVEGRTHPARKGASACAKSSGCRYVLRCGNRCGPGRLARIDRLPKLPHRRKADRCESARCVEPSLAFSSKRLMHSRSLSIPLLGCWVIVGHVPAPILSCTRCVRQRGLPPSSARLPGVHGSGGWPCSVCGGAGHTSQYLDRGRQHRPGAPAFSRHGGSSHHPGGARAFGRGRPVVHARGQVRRFKLEAVSQYGQFVEPVYSR